MLDGRADIVTDISLEPARTSNAIPSAAEKHDSEPARMAIPPAGDATRRCSTGGARSARLSPLLTATGWWTSGSRFASRPTRWCPTPCSASIRPCPTSRTTRTKARAPWPGPVILGGLTLTLMMSGVRASPRRRAARQMAPAGIRLELDIRDRQLCGGHRPFWLAGFNSTSGDASDLMDDLFRIPPPASTAGTTEAATATRADRNDRNAGRAAEPAGRLHTMQRLMVMIMQDMPRVLLFVEDDLRSLAGGGVKPRLDMRVLAKEVRRPAP